MESRSRGPAEPHRYPTEMTVDVRQADAQHADEISDFVSTLAREHIASSLGSGGIELLLVSLDSASTHQRLSDGWPHLIAFENGELVGVIVVKPPLHLYHLFVRTDLQRTGIGSRLLAEADRIVSQSTGEALLTVNSSLNAVDAYKRFGFVSDGLPVDSDGVRFVPMIRTKSG